MSFKSKILLLVLILTCIAFNGFCQEGDAVEKNKHFIFIGVNPITVFFCYYEAEVSVAITGLFEVGAQISYLDITGYMEMFDYDGMQIPTEAYMMHIGVVARIFPSQTAEGFFISGRLMMLQAADSEAGYDFTDFAGGIDLGWRFRWMIDDWGFIFQAFFGIERAITQQEALEFLPIIPVGGLHFGVCF